MPSNHSSNATILGASVPPQHPNTQKRSSQENSSKLVSAMGIVIGHLPRQNYQKLMLVCREFRTLYGTLLPPELGQIFASVLTTQNKTNEQISNYGLSSSKNIPALQEVMDQLQTVWPTQYVYESSRPSQAMLFAKAIQKLLAGCNLNAASLPNALKTTAQAWLQHEEYCLNRTSSLLWTLKKPELKFLASVFSEQTDSNTHQAIIFAQTKQGILETCPKIPNDRDAWYEGLDLAFKKDLDILKLMVPITSFGKYTHNLENSLRYYGTSPLNMGSDPSLRIKTILKILEETQSENQNTLKSFLNYLSKEVPATIFFLTQTISLQNPEHYQRFQELAKVITSNQGNCLRFINRHFNFAHEGRLDDYQNIATIALQQNPDAFEHAHNKLDLTNAQQKEIHLNLAELACHACENAFKTVTDAIDLNTANGLKSYKEKALAAIKFSKFNLTWTIKNLNLENHEHGELYRSLIQFALEQPKGFYFIGMISDLDTEIDQHLQEYENWSKDALKYENTVPAQIFQTNKINLYNPKHFDVFSRLAESAIKHPNFNLENLNKLNLRYPNHLELYLKLAQKGLRNNGLLLEDANLKFDLEINTDLASYTNLAKTAVSQNPAAMGAVFLKFAEYTNTHISALPENLKKAYQEIGKQLPAIEASSIQKTEPYAFQYANHTFKLTTNRYHFDAYKQVAQLIQKTKTGEHESFYQAFELCNQRFGLHTSHLNLVERLGAYLITRFPYNSEAILSALRATLDTNNYKEKEVLQRIAEWQI